MKSFRLINFRLPKCSSIKLSFPWAVFIARKTVLNFKRSFTGEKKSLKEGRKEKKIGLNEEKVEKQIVEARFLVVIETSTKRAKKVVEAYAFVLRYLQLYIFFIFGFGKI